MAAPFGDLKYLYVGTKSFDEDFRYYQETLGGELVWNFAASGARVAAFRLGPGPLVLIADHRPAPSCLPVFAAKDLQRTVAALKKRGWTPDAGPFGIPDGPCYMFHDPSGNSFAVFENVRPDALTHEYERERREKAAPSRRGGARAR